jgi:hypothetical protein
MTFVKVVGGIEIYNFRIQSFMHFYTKFWSFSILINGLATRLGPNAASRARAPAYLGVRATRCSRPHAGRGVPLPHAPRPEAIGVLSAARTPQTAGPSAAPAVRAPDEAAVPQPHLQGHALVSASEPPYLNRAPCPSSHRHHRPPHHPRRRR